MSGSGPSPAEGPPSTLDLLDAVDALLAEARRVPFSGSVVVNDEELMQLVEHIRLSLPAELVRAQQLLDQRESVLADTEERAGRQLARAEATAQELSARVEADARALAEQSRAHASQVVAQAQAEARMLTEEAQRRAEELVTEHSVLRAAEERAALVLSDAEERARQATAEAEGYVRDADDYVRSLMTKLEEHLVRVTATVRQGLGALSPSAPSRRRRGSHDHRQ